MRYGKTTWLFVTRGNENVKITKKEGERVSAGERSWPKRETTSRNCRRVVHETRRSMKIADESGERKREKRREREKGNEES